jgi:hypothetical protein
MKYPIIPKHNFSVKLDLKLTNEELNQHISHSLIHHIDNIHNQLLKLNETVDNSINMEYINKIINPFEFIYSNVPGSSISVSKVKYDSIICELTELFQIFNINDFLSSKHKINTAQLTHNHISTNILLNKFCENSEDLTISHNFDFDDLYNIFITNNYNNKLDILICEFTDEDYNNTHKYMNNIVLVLLILIKYQSSQGICIVKIKNILYKPIIDVIFILSGIYDKVYLVKPTISNITKSDRYIVCKGFNETLLYKSKLLNNIEINLISKMNNILNSNLYISSILENEIPYYFLNKLQENNIIIGQQQLEAYDQIINMIKNKNHDEKIENLKRLNIQKCIQWCEKNQLPYNTFTDKTNIFLTSNI